METRLSNIIGGLLLCLIFTLLGSKMPTPPGNKIDNVFFVAIFSHLAFLILGVLSFILRFSNFIYRHTFFYVFIGISNAWLGVLEFTLYFIGKVNSGALEAGIPNLVIGIILLIDEFRHKPSSQSSS